MELSFPTVIPDAVNPQIINNLPSSVEIGNGLSIQLALTSPLTISNNEILEIAIDGTIFVTSEGYSHDGDVATLPGNDASLTEGLQVQISDYVLTGAMKGAAD